MNLYLKLVTVLFCGLIPALGGGWLASRYFRPQLEAVRLEASRCTEAQGALQLQLAEQNRRVDQLALAARQREAAAALALQAVQAESASHEAAAQRLLAGHAEGEDCAVARDLIDRELAP